MFKITCFEEHMQTAASIICYFDTINLSQSGFCTIYFFKFLVSERKYENNLKNRESQKTNLMFYCKIPWFYQDFKSENLYFLNLYSVHTARILDLSLEIMLSPPKLGTKHQLKRLFLHAGTGIIFLFFRSQIHQFL